MNTKRQTVWLVSMLSLMVVLSAYYLFTEDVNELDLATQQAAGSEIKVDAVTTGTAPKTDTVDGKAAADKAAADQANASAMPPADKATTAPVASGAKKTDEEVIKQVSTVATSGNDYFAGLHMKRTEEFSKQMEKWLTIQTDSKKSNDEVTLAMNEIQKLQDLDEKVTSIEDYLAKDFKNAIVLQESGKWKVVVQTAKLEKSQGVSIVDYVMNELNVTPDKVTIQYVQ